MCRRPMPFWRMRDRHGTAAHALRGTGIGDYIRSRQSAHYGASIWGYRDGFEPGGGGGGCWILEAVPRQSDHYGGRLREEASRDDLTDSGDGRSACRLPENSFQRRKHEIGFENLFIADGFDQPAGLVTRGERSAPVGRIPNSNGRCDRFGIRYGLAGHDRRGA